MVLIDTTPYFEESLAFVDLGPVTPADESFQGNGGISFPSEEGVAVHLKKPRCFCLRIEAIRVNVRAGADHSRVMERVFSV